MTINDILKNNINNEKKLALGQVLNLSKPELIANKAMKLTRKEYKKYKKLSKKIDKGIPIQYIFKESNFYGYDFYVNKDVLIPRPETEVLIQKTQNLIKKHLNQDKIAILDIGTGSGAIAITLKKLNHNYNITATDISRKALRVAKKNKKIHKVDINLIRTDLYKGINSKYDVIISNPPYIDKSSTQIEEKVKKYEPHIALFANDNGLYYYEEILKNVERILKRKHIIAFEIGENQSNQIRKIAKKYLPKDRIIEKKDYNDLDRYVFIIGGTDD